METNNAAICMEALGNTTRLEIFRLLVRAGPNGAPVGRLQDLLGIPGSTLSHHIARLVRVGLVSQERRSRVLICRAEYVRMDALLAFLGAECCQGLVADGASAIEDCGQDCGFEATGGGQPGDGQHANDGAHGDDTNGNGAREDDTHGDDTHDEEVA